MGDGKARQGKAGRRSRLGNVKGREGQDCHERV